MFLFGGLQRERYAEIERNKLQVFKEAFRRMNVNPHDDEAFEAIATLTPDIEKGGTALFHYAKTAQGEGARQDLLVAKGLAPNQLAARQLVQSGLDINMLQQEQQKQTRVKENLGLIAANSDLMPTNQLRLFKSMAIAGHDIPVETLQNAQMAKLLQDFSTDYPSVWQNWMNNIPNQKEIIDQVTKDSRYVQLSQDFFRMQATADVAFKNEAYKNEQLKIGKTHLELQRESLDQTSLLETAKEAAIQDGVVAALRNNWINASPAEKPALKRELDIGLARQKVLLDSLSQLHEYNLKRYHPDIYKNLQYRALSVTISDAVSSKHPADAKRKIITDTMGAARTAVKSGEIDEPTGRAIIQEGSNALQRLGPLGEVPEGGFGAEQQRVPQGPYPDYLPFPGSFSAPSVPSPVPQGPAAPPVVPQPVPSPKAAPRSQGPPLRPQIEEAPWESSLSREENARLLMQPKYQYARGVFENLTPEDQEAFAQESRKKPSAPQSLPALEPPEIVKSPEGYAEQFAAGWGPKYTAPTQPPPRRAKPQASAPKVSLPEWEVPSLIRPEDEERIRERMERRKRGVVAPPVQSPTLEPKPSQRPPQRLPGDVSPAPTQKDKEDFRRAWPKGKPPEKHVTPPALRRYAPGERPTEAEIEARAGSIFQKHWKALYPYSAGDRRNLFPSDLADLHDRAQNQLLKGERP